MSLNSTTNFKYLFTLTGLFKLASIITLIISLSLGGHAYDNSLYNTAYQFFSRVLTDFDIIVPNGINLVREKIFLATTTAVLIFSILSLTCHMSNVDMPLSSRTLAIDILFHAIAAVLLLIAGSLEIDSSRKINKTGCGNSLNWEGRKCQLRAEKDFAGIFALIASVIFGFITARQGSKFNTRNVPYTI